VGVPDAYRGQAPKAFIVFKADEMTSEQEILSYCRERLAPYKIPRSIEFVAALPRNHAGKLLRRALRVGSI
jgi:long-chain acyl-CoA synthetase